MTVNCCCDRLEVDLDNAEAYLILNLLSGIGPLRVNQLLSFFGEARLILTASHAQLARVPGIGERFAEILCNWHMHCEPDKERELVERGGAVIVTREDAEYPPLLREIHDPPLCLYVRGNVKALENSQAAIAIVGSRRTTRYGIRVAENLASAAALAGWTVISGLARGIDTVAHQSVLRVEGCTIAVLGSGLGQIYPQENVELARRIMEDGGAVISEFPMLFRPEKRTFPMRNRIISGMTRGCIVVEAGHRSGSLITAAQALEQNRQVFAVPGPIDSPMSRGCHSLIKDGAKLVENFGDVLEEFVQLPGFSRSGTTVANKDENPKSEGELAYADLQLSELERKVLIFLGDGETVIDEMIAAFDEPASKVLGALVNLEMRRLVRQLPGKRVVGNMKIISG